MVSKKMKLSCCKISFLGKLHNLIIYPRFVGSSFYTNNGLKYDLFSVNLSAMVFFKFTDFIISKQMGPIHRKKDIKKGKGKQRSSK